MASAFDVPAAVPTSQTSSTPPFPQEWKSVGDLSLTVTTAASETETKCRRYLRCSDYDRITGGRALDVPWVKRGGSLGAEDA